MIFCYVTLFISDDGHEEYSHAMPYYKQPVIPEQDSKRENTYCKLSLLYKTNITSPQSLLKNKHVGHSIDKPYHLTIHPTN